MGSLSHEVGAAPSVRRGGRANGVRVVACAAFALFFAHGASAAQEAVFGYLENVLIYPGPFSMQAKLDTGADHSSIHARILKRERRNDREWLTFQVVNRAGAKTVFEKPLLRTAKVRRYSGAPQTRPVVMMELCLGAIRRTVEVNLVDRNQLNFKMLIGRSFMAGHALVDSGATFTAPPSCR